MVQKDIDVGEARVVEISSEDDVAVVGWDGEAISLVADAETPDSVSIERADDAVRMRAEGDVRMQIPRRLHVKISHAGGDLRASAIDGGIEVAQAGGDVRIQDVRGDVRIDRAAGDVEIRSVEGAVRLANVAGDLRTNGIQGDVTGSAVAGDADVERVSGNLDLEGQVGGDLVLGTIIGAATVGSVAGDLGVAGCHSLRIGTVAGDLRLEDSRDDVEVDHVGGDAALDDCRGVVTLRHVGGDLRARRLAGGLVAPRIGGDLRLRTAFSPGCEYVASCGGSASIVLAGNPAHASVSFELRCSQDRINVALPLDDVTRERGFLVGRLGAGEAKVRVESGERIRLAAREPEPGFEGIMDDVFAGIEAGMHEAFGVFEGPGRQRFEQRMREVNERIARATEEIQRRTAERLEAQAQKMARKAEEMAQRAAERAAEHVTRQAERTWRGGAPGWGSGWWRRGATPPPPQPPPPKPRATEEERLTVLRMLAEGKITAEQAARLLEALGG
jgi:hypothetical protein